MKKVSVRFVALLMCIGMLFLQGCSFDFSALLQPEMTPSEIYYTYANSVVEVTAEAAGFAATGTGFFCDENGTVITNYHVIETCASAKITLLDGTTYDVTRVMGYSVDKDIAILATGCKNTVPLTFRTDGVITGEKVYAIGSSLGLTSTLSSGIVSCARRLIYGDELIQITAPISPGNSGGPLFDAYGNVVGITSSQMVDGQNLNFAIPIVEAEKLKTNNPTILPELFTRTSQGNGRVKTLGNWSMHYFSEEESKSGENQFALFFQLYNGSGDQVKTGGSAKIEIVNELGVTVYQKTLTFTQEDIYSVSNRRGDFDFTAIFFDMEDVTPGDAYSGMIHFTISGSDYAFEPCAIRIDYLPVDY